MNSNHGSPRALRLWTAVEVEDELPAAEAGAFRDLDKALGADVDSKVGKTNRPAALPCVSTNSVILISPPMKTSPFLQRHSAALLLTCLSSLNLKAATPAIAAGSDHSLFLKSDGTVWGVGANNWGNLGDGTTTGSDVPVQTMTGVKAIETRMGGSLFLKVDGSVWAAGENSTGQLGDGTKTNRITPVQILSGVKACSFGLGHSLFLKTDGTVWATGSNSFGQLGDGTTTERTTPVQVLGDVRAIAAGGNFSLFLKTDDTVWATGSNFKGQFGNGTEEWIGSMTPIPVLTGINPPLPVMTAKAISAGSDHSLFLKEDGTVWAAGFNPDGRLGDGTTIVRSSPVLVMSGVKAISTGLYHSLFLKENGTAWGAGSNFRGELGDGTTTDRATPVQVLTGVKAIAGGREHSLFLRTDGMVWATGSNSLGKLGDGTAIQRTSPVPILQLITNAAMAWQEEHFGDDAADLVISGWDADPDHDGVVNLLERAFNLPPLQAGRPILLPQTGTSGLPLIRAVDEPGQRTFSIQYLRRKASTNSGLTYTPQFSSNLEDGGAEGWIDAIGPEIVEDIDPEWERVTVEDDATGVPKRFGRVKVSSED